MFQQIYLIILELYGRVFQVVVRGGGMKGEESEILFWGNFFLGGENLRRRDFDLSNLFQI